MAALAYYGDPISMEVGFTPEDRRALTTLEVEAKHQNEQLKDLLQRIARMEDSRVTEHDLQGIYTDVDEIRLKHKETSKDHEDRIRSLEKQRWIWAGSAAAILAIVEVGLKVLFGK